MKLIILLLFQAVFFVVHATTFHEIAQTPHLMVVTQYGCETTFESNIGSAGCPSFFTRPASPMKPECKDPMKIHLVRDSEKLNPPKLLYVFEHSKGTKLFLRDIPNIHFVVNSSKIAIQAKQVKIGESSSFVILKDIWAKIINSIYDNDKQMLYIMTTSGPHAKPHCYVYYLRNLFSTEYTQRFAADMLFGFDLHPNVSGKFHWTADAYTNLVYYVTHKTQSQDDDIIPRSSSLHQTHMNKLYAVLRYGEDGQALLSHIARSDYYVSGGMVFSYSLGANNQFSGYTRSASNHSGYGIQCNATISEFSLGFRTIPGFSSVLAVRDEDYCLVYKLSKAECTYQKKRYLASLGLIEEEKDDGLGAGTITLVVLVILLGTLVVLLLLCLCCMKRNFEKSFEEQEQRPQQLLYYPGASNLSRNRSYLDESVDTWR